MKFNTEKLDVLLVEGDPAQIELTIFLLKKIGINQVRIATNYKEAIIHCNNRIPNIALIDVLLPNSKSGTGIEVGQYIKQHSSVPIIFTTTNYTDRIYQKAKLVKPYAFLNKELSVLKLKQIIELAIQAPQVVVDANPTLGEIESPLECNFFITPENPHFFIRIGNHLKKIKLEDILYFGVEEKHTMIVLKDKKIPIRVSLKEMAERLSNQHFTRIHKSYMININRVELIDTMKNELILCGEKLPVGRSFRNKLLSKISLI